MTDKITCENVTVEGKNKNILNHINLSLKDKQIVGLLGRNGAGKTTLLSLIASFIKPDAGRVLIDGEVAFENPEQMGKVLFMYSRMMEGSGNTVNHFVRLHSELYDNFDLYYAQCLLDKFKIDQTSNYLLLSKGEQAAVNISIGLASRAEITIFDETYTGLDEPSRLAFYEELLRDFERHPRLIIMSTHLVSETEYLFEDLVFIKNGEVLLHESYDDLLQKSVVVTGFSEDIDVISEGKNILHTKSIGRKKEVTLYHVDYENIYGEAKTINPHVSLKPASLQIIFNKLTEDDENEK